ncbi:MAG TPA: carboxypeptidase regulatory-like domain-containing protein [Bryobacteraceae bacterium]|nr:carboxypeptidase regulatory-like domain-containing protein [Bryobacteraceae bacterium]
MKRINILILSVLLLAAGAFAQTATLSGQVADETGAVVPGAKVTLAGPGNVIKSVTSDSNGSYSAGGLAPGAYTVTAAAPDLAMQPVQITLRTGVQTLNLQLKVASTVQQVTVQETVGPAVSTEVTNNANQLVLRGEDLQSLSDDPDDLQADLEALAGPSAGPSGGSIFIDGFSGGELPPKSSIREIRINQNPFAPEYDHIGFGSIEIFTKPGSDKLRGSLFYNFANQIWNSRNPYSAEKADLSLNEFGGNLSGALSRRTSFTLDVQDNIVDNGSIVNAVTLDPKTLAITPFYQNTTTPQHRFTISPRIDYALSPSNTLVVRYSATKIGITNGNIGGFNLPERGYGNDYLSQTVQVTETAVFGTKINETRFQYYRSSSELAANTAAPALNVLSSFNGGGATVGHTSDDANYYELQNNTTIPKGAHQVKFGVRMRGQTDNNTSPSNFLGTFTFGGGTGPELDANNQPIAGTSTQITSIERYQRTLLFQGMGYTPSQIQALGGEPSQFSMSAGNPYLALQQMDAGVFAGDDWKLRPNFTISLGVRYEMQTNIADHNDWAPRIGFAWAPGGANNPKPKTVFRGGFGMFYDRFALGNTLTAERYNGTVQQAYVVTNPLFFPNIPSLDMLNGALAPQVRYVKDSNLHSSYLMQTALTVERQLPSNATLAVTYTNSHGLHELRSFNINSPLLGTYPANPVYPYGNADPLLLMTSSGLFNQNQLVTNINSRLNQNVSLFGFYMWSKAMSNTDGLGTYPASPYSQDGEYAPSAYDVRHRAFIGGSINTKWNMRFSPFVNLNSGAPFNITTGSDPYGTSLFTARPAIATDHSLPGLIQTPYGLLDPNPSPGEKIIPRNFGRGPGQYTVNLRVSKTFGLGPEKESASGNTPQGGMGGGPGHDHGPMGGIFAAPTTDRKYNLTVSMQGRNLFNHTNPGPITGNITSPLFGQANTMAGGGGMFSENANNRRLELQMRFTF